MMRHALSPYCLATLYDEYNAVRPEQKYRDYMQKILKTNGYDGAI